MLLAALAAACGPPPGRGTEALVGATVVDVVNGSLLPNAVVLVRDGRIVALGNAAEIDVPRGATLTDLRQRWLIPGLIDAHTHLQPWGLESSLRYGVTAVRELYDGLTLAVALQRTAREGAGPHLFMAAQPSGAQSGACTNALADARRGVRLGEQLSGVPEATGDSVALCAAYRQGFLAGWTASARSWSRGDTTRLATIARELAARGVVLLPTLVLHETLSRLDDAGLYRSADLAGVPDSARSNWNVKAMIRRAGWTRKDYPVFRAARGRQDNFIHAFVLAGGKVVAGSDASRPLLVPGASLHTEMELLAHAGLSPIDALRSATLWSAELLHADSLGALRAGAVADLVVLGANPLADIRNSRAIVRVMVQGRWLPR